MKRIAVYAGTFDPPTNGHLWVISQAARLFDEVVVAVAVNAAKKTMFSVQERVDMLWQSTAQKNVRVVWLADEYVARYAVSINAEFLVRGIRTGQDLEYERVITNINRDIASDIVTVLLPAPPEIADLSSSAIKSLVGPQSWEQVVARYVSVPVLRKLLAKHYDLWKELVSYGAFGNEEKFWKPIFAAYAQSHRHYHTRTHIEQMLQEFEKVKHELNEPAAVKLAIWFHDFVYDPREHDNEEKSALILWHVANELNLRDAFVNQACKLVLATRHPSRPTDFDAQYLVDMDLSILGQSPAEFDVYEAGIRQEFSFLSDAKFAAGRSKFLRKLLKQKSLYLTDIFADLYEAKARANLNRSLAKLAKK